MRAKMFVTKTPESIPLNDIKQIAQVAGHAGFFSCIKEPQKCLKPINICCLRGRRENLFYQMIECAKATQINNIPIRNLGPLNVRNKICDCKLDRQVLVELAQLIPTFYGLKHANKNSFKLESWDQFSDDTCLCYPNDESNDHTNGTRSCSRDSFCDGTFLCLENLTAHCKKPWIMDIKIGAVTHDPMASREKIIEQSTKYSLQTTFGFRILGIKAGQVTKGKDFGKELETEEQVLVALDYFLKALNGSKRKTIVISRILEKIREIENWFSARNVGQFCFYSSSLLIVYDGFDGNSLDSLKQSVRVSMIDFAHVFHVHDKTAQQDNNYLYGLRNLQELFVQLCKLDS